MSKPQLSLVDACYDDFSLTVSRHGSATTIRIVGVLDLARAEDVRALGELAATGTEDLIVDLSELTFLDSTGIGALIAIRNRAQADGVPMCVRGASERIARIFQIIGLAETFGITT